MENTFRQHVEAEGQKQGYLNALNITYQLHKHEVIEEDAVITLPDMATILEKA